MSAEIGIVVVLILGWVGLVAWVTHPGPVN